MRQRIAVIFATLSMAAVLAAVFVTTGPSLNTERLTTAAALYDATVMPATATIHRSDTCQCCGGHRDYLIAAGFVVTEEMHAAADMTGVKQTLSIPRELWSCHTTVIDGYAVEGHVPVDVIKALLVERPDTDGLALPNMPAGSPGMPGTKNETWVFSRFVDGQTQGVFARL